MLLLIDPLKALQSIGSPRPIHEDIVVPAEFPACPDSYYRPEYDWLSRYERRIAAFLERWLRPYRYELIGEKGILCEALSNAFCHGHAKDPQQPIYVRVVEGDQGLIVQIQDSGPGFDVEKIFGNYRNGESYYITAGNGIRLMAESERFGIYYNDRGTTFHMLYMFARNGLALLPPEVIRLTSRHRGGVRSSHLTK
jgi:anti-sigma regulatory factor (Ser/Thr protein kinase)